MSDRGVKLVVLRPVDFVPIAFDHGIDGTDPHFDARLLEVSQQVDCCRLVGQLKALRAKPIKNRLNCRFQRYSIQSIRSVRIPTQQIKRIVAVHRP